jgi:hypothetical protein
MEWLTEMDISHRTQTQLDSEYQHRYTASAKGKGKKTDIPAPSSPPSTPTLSAPSTPSTSTPPTPSTSTSPHTPIPMIPISPLPTFSVPASSSSTFKVPLLLLKVRLINIYNNNYKLIAISCGFYFITFVIVYR